MLDQSAAEKARLLQFADCGALVKRVVPHGLNGLENGDAAPAEHFEVNAQAGVHHFCKRPSFGKQGACARNEILHQTDEAIIEAALNDIAFSKALGCGGVEGDIDTTFVEVARCVLPEIRELQRGASSVGKALALLVAIAAEVEDQAANRIGGIDAVTENGVPIRVTLRGLILAKSL